MNLSNFFKNVFLSGIEVDGYDPIIRKLFLVNILLLMGIIFLLFFTIYNLFISTTYDLAFIDLIALSISIFGFIDLRKNQKLQRASTIATLNAFGLMLTLVYFAEGRDFTLIWTVFVPIFAIFINGSKKGILITALFYIIVFVITYNGIDEWQNGTWNFASYVRLVAASLGLTFIAYFFERSFERAYKELAESKKIKERYIAELEHSSITDPLTQLYNRRYLDVQFDEQFDKAKKNGSLFAFFILDVDYFKKYNDTYGHKAGDEALQKIASVLKEAMKRDSDSVFRVGGEEFCGLLMADTQEKIVGSIENLRKCIRDLNLVHTQNEHQFITVSIGVCMIHSFETKDLDKMYKIADDALYVAKEDGRNCMRGAEIISTL